MAEQQIQENRSKAILVCLAVFSKGFYRVILRMLLVRVISSKPSHELRLSWLSVAEQ